MSSLFKNANVPDWFNIALGYSADGMFGGFKNVWVDNFMQVERDDISRIRQYYLSLDINLAKLKPRSRAIKTLLSLLNHVKVPFSALSFDNQNGLKFHPIYF